MYKEIEAYNTKLSSKDLGLEMIRFSTNW